MCAQYATEPLSHVDAAWLRMDCPNNPMVINALLLFREHIPYPTFEALFRERVLSQARFRQRVIDAELPLLAPRWLSEPKLDLALHLHHLRLPQPADRKALETLLSDLASSTLPRDRPLWQAYVIDDVEGGTGLFVRVHHAIGDGVALVRVLLSLCDDRVKAPVQVGLGKHAPAENLAQLTRRASAQAATLGKLLLLPGDADTTLQGPLASHKRVAWSDPLPLAEVKRVAAEVNGKVNDVLQSCVAGSLQRYLTKQGAVLPPTLRTLVTVFLRGEDHGIGNHFGLVFLDLPMRADNARERLAQVKRGLDELKSSEDATVAFAVLDAIGIASPTLEHIALEVFTRKASLVTTNVPGPPERIQLAGHELSNVLVWAPTAGHVGLGFTLLSYAGEVRLGVLADAGRVNDLSALVAGFTDEFNALTQR